MRTIKMYFGIGVFSLAGAFAASSVSAQTLAVSPVSVSGQATGGPTSPNSVALVYAPPAVSPQAGFQADLTFNTAVITATPTVVSPAGYFNSCNIVSPGVIRLVVLNTAVGGTADAGTYCNVALSVAPGAAVATYPLTLGAFVNIATGTNGAVVVAAGPAAPTVGPLAATSLSMGPINTTATGTVPVSITGAGSPVASLALSCSIPATGASAFAITSNGTQTINAPATIGPGAPIGVSCTRTAADVIATLTCTQTATPTAMLPNLTAAITCPAGVTAPNPGSTPAAPGPIALIGSPGATATGNISFTNAGGTLAYSVTGCTPSTGYATPTTFPVNVAAGGTGAVAVTCTAPAAAGTSAAPGTLACTTSAAGFNPTFNVTCSAQSASIPTLGFGGKALMVLLMLGFGLVGFQLYRRSA